MSKTTRFPVHKRKNSTEFTVLPSTLALRSAGMGFGRRWNPLNVTGCDSPPPGSYNLPSLASNKGPRIVMDNGKIGNCRNLTPGPGSYEPLKPLGLNKPKFALKGRIRRIDAEDTPAPGAYSPSFGLTQYTGYAKISFGTGERSDFGKKEWGPGPGAYEIWSNFDKAK